MSSRENNWHCKECNQENYATRGSCLRCYELKPSVEGVRERPHEGYITFEKGSTSATRTEVMHGDWICHYCHTPNASMRETCFNCDAGKESFVGGFFNPIDAASGLSGDAPSSMNDSGLGMGTFPTWIDPNLLHLEFGGPDHIYDRHDFESSLAELVLALLRRSEGNHQPTGAFANLINGLPQSTVETDDFADVCAICLDTPEKGETIRDLPCSHKFHKDCIDAWLYRKPTCPLCKASII